MDKLSEVQNFLRVICVTAETELTIMASDKIREWKLLNATSIFSKAKKIAEKSKDTLVGSVNPKVALNIIENGSNENDPELQEMWAGLFYSSINDASNDENLIYTNILRQITIDEAKLIKHMCENCTVKISRGGLPIAIGESLYAMEFVQLIGSRPLDYFESLIAHIHSLRLNIIKWGGSGEIFRFMQNKNDYVIHLIPTLLCLNLYLRCTGYRGTIEEYYIK